MGISFHSGPTGEPGRGLIYRRLREMNKGGSRNSVFLSEEAQCRGPLGRAPLLLLGTLEDMLRKAMDMGISLYRGPIGDLEGICFLGLLRENDSISGFLSWTQMTLILSMGTI